MILLPGDHPGSRGSRREAQNKVWISRTSSPWPNSPKVPPWKCSSSPNDANKFWIHQWTNPLIKWEPSQPLWLSVNRFTSWGPSPQHMKHFVREGTSQPQGNSCGHCVTMHSIFHWVAWNHSAALYQLLLPPADRVPKLPFLSEQYHQTETLANLMNVKCALVEISSNICPWELLNCPTHSPQ